MICALTTLVVEIYQTPDPALTIYVAFFVIKPDRAASVAVSIIMMLLMTSIVALVLLTTTLVINHPLWRVSAIAVMSFCLLFAASASKLKPVASTIALIAGYALDLLGTAHLGEIATRALLYAWLFVAIPATTSIVVNLLIGPAPRKLIERTLAYRLRLAAAMLRGADEKVGQAFSECLHEGLGEIPAWLKLAEVEQAGSASDLAALAQAGRSTCAILSLVDLIVTSLDTEFPAPGRKALAACLDQIAGILESGGYPLDIALEQEIAPDATPLAVAVLTEVKEALTVFAVAPAPYSTPAAKSHSAFFVPDAFTNPAHVQYALKSTAAAMLCYITYSLLDWPGIHTCFITCYIVSLGTTAETIEKLTLRILGCLIGAALGLGAIVFVMPSVTSIGVLMAIVAGAAFVSAWIAAGGPRISYVGLQLAFAFFLSVVQGAGPAFDMTIARDRVIGIILGNLVVALIFTQLWPVTVAKRVDPAIVDLLRKMAGLATERVGWKRSALVGETQAAFGAVEQDVALTRYEPLSIRPIAAWIECRERILSAVGRCQGPLLLAGRADSQVNSDVAGRLERLAASLEQQGRSVVAPDQAQTSPSPDDPGPATFQNFPGFLEGPLTELEAATACVSEQAPDSGRADYAVV